MLACNSDNSKRIKALPIDRQESFKRFTKSRTAWNRAAIPRERWQKQFALQNTEKINTAKRKSTRRQERIMPSRRQVPPIMMEGESELPTWKYITAEKKIYNYLYFHLLFNRYNMVNYAYHRFCFLFLQSIVLIAICLPYRFFFLLGKALLYIHVE